MSRMWYFKSPPNGLVPLGIHLSCLFAVKVSSLTPIQMECRRRGYGLVGVTYNCAVRIAGRFLGTPGDTWC